MPSMRVPLMPVRRRVRPALALAAGLCLGSAPALSAPPASPGPSPARPAAAVVAAPPAAPTVPPASALNAPLFYQLLIGELQIAEGDPRAAYELILDAARRTQDEALYRRATEIALQSRAGDQALAAIRAWRGAHPRSIEAQRNFAQLLIALNRPAEAVEPLRALIGLTPASDRAELIALVPRFFGNVPDTRAASSWVDQTVQPWLEDPATRVAVRVAMARAAVAAKDAARALQLAQQAQGLDPQADGPAFVALELLPGRSDAEVLVTRHLAARPQSLGVQLGYARVLATAQRYVEAIAQLEAVTQVQPALAAPWLTLGALHLELRHPVEATAALKRYLDAQQGPLADTPARPEAAGTAAPPVPEAPGLAELRARADAEGRAEGRTTAYLLLAQAAEMDQRFADAETWLQKIENPGSALEVLARRASLMARQGQVDAARELLRRAPEREPQDRRAKLLAEAQLLRDLKRWPDAMQVMEQAAAAFPDDTDILYEQSMVAEKLGRLDQMESLLRTVIRLKPDHHHAYNALGYTLADRNVRLPEARELIRKALELAPGEPFITDSLGWVEYRLGNGAEALRLLRQAYAARPDVEIGAHLGEVLWTQGLKDEARRVWRESRQRDAGNEVLRETLRRLQVDL